MAGTTLNITDAGRAALIAGDHTGTTARKVVQVGFATAPFDFTPALQVLPSELKRVSTIAGENIASDTIHVTIRDDGAEQFKLYGFGLYLDNGVLLGTYCQAEPIMEKSPVAILLLAVDVVFKSLDVTALSFGETNFTNPPATTERQGVVELATNEETQEGTDKLRVVTPAALTARTSTEARTGLVQLATDAEAGTGKDDTKAVTPKKLAAQLTKKAELAGSNKQAFAVAVATTAEQAVPLGQADERYATPAAVKEAKDMAGRALKTAEAALPSSGGDMTGPINLKGQSVELQLTDTQQAITQGRFRMVSAGGQLVIDRNTAADGGFSTFVRVCAIEGNGNVTTPGTVTSGGIKTQANLNLPPYNNDGKGFLEFGGDTVAWRLFSVGASGDLQINTYNTNGTVKAQPLSINWTTGQAAFSARPTFATAVPWDSSNLKAPLTAEGGPLNAHKGLNFSVGYGRTALTVSPVGSDSIGGSHLDWSGNRTSALQIDCPTNTQAYMGLRWTQWGARHLAAIDVYAGGSNGSAPILSMHVGGRANAFTFNGDGNFALQGAVTTGGGGVLAADGNVYMPWAGQWLSTYLTNLNNSITYVNNTKAGAGAQCQRAGATQSFGVISGNPVLPHPWVVVGLTGPGNGTANAITVYGDWLRNQ